MLEVQNQGVLWVDFFWGHTPWLVDGCLGPVSSHGFPSVHVCVLISFFLEKYHSGLDPLWLPHFDLIPSVKTLSPNTLSFGELGIRLYTFGGHNLVKITWLVKIKLIIKIGAYKAINWYNMGNWEKSAFHKIEKIKNVW